jgi:DNA-binding MarR family transcriptional regulator
LSLEVLALTEEVRRAFMALRLAADATNAEDGIVASVRAVLQHLAEEGPSTVPAMAEAKAITRQAMQERVNVLLARGLVAVRPNPKHRRSGLVALTGEGAATYRRMTAREAEALEGVAAALEPGEAIRAMVTLRKVIAALGT